MENNEFVIKRQRFVDTSKLIAIGPDGVSDLNYEPVVNSYVKQELTNHNFTFPSGTTITEMEIPSWPNFGNPICEGNWGKYYKWTDSTSGKSIDIWRYNRSLQHKTACGCDTSVQIFYEGKTFYCCESIAKKDADFSVVIETILYPEKGPADTLDRHLCQTCKFIHSLILFNQQNNSSS